MAYTKQNFTDQQVLTAGHLNHIENGIANILDTVYPVGSIYMSSNSTSPASLFGGTWEQIADRVIVGAGGLYDVNSTGGEAEHTLTYDELPKQVVVNMGSNAHYTTPNLVSGGSWANPINQTGGTGDQPHNNMQPYITKYIWERVE